MKQNNFIGHNRKLKALIFLSLLMFCIPLISAYSNNSFYNGSSYLTTENMTMDDWIIRYLKVPTSVNALTNAFLNLTGYNDSTDYSNMCNYKSFYCSGYTPYTVSGCPSDHLHCAGGDCCINDAGNQMVDSYWNTVGAVSYSSGTLGYKHIMTFTYPATSGNVLNVSYSFGLVTCGAGGCSAGFRLYCYDYSTSSMSLLDQVYTSTPSTTAYYNSSKIINTTNYNGCLMVNGGNVTFRYEALVGGVTGTSYVYIYGLNITQIGSNPYPSDVTLSVGSTGEGRDYELPAGEFNTTNKTNNLANWVNQIIPDCTCSDCILSGGFCSVPFYFYSAMGGILNYNTLIFNNSKIIENSQTYNSASYPSASETFIINFTYDTGLYTSVSGKLNYNNTEYSGTLTGSGTTKLLTATITTPSSNTEVSYPFYWNISMTNATGITYLKSNNYTQSMSTLNMRICNTTPYNTTFINFTVFNSEATTSKINSSFKASFYFGSNSSTIGYTHQDTSQTNSSFAFCFIPPSLNYTISASIEYEATGYSKNYYYLNDITVTNATTNISLYLLNSTKSTVTQLKVQNIYTQPQENVYITIQRYDAGTDTYYTVGMARTDFNGQDIVYLNWYDTFYKYILTRNGVTVKITNQSKVDTTPILFKLEDTYIYTYDKFGSITYTLTFNNVTNNFIFTYSDPTGDVNSYCLRVVKRFTKNDTLICNTCESSSSATIYCNVNAYGNGTYVAIIYGQGSLAGWDSLVAYIGTINKIYNLIGNTDGSIYAFFLGAIVLVMFLFSPVMAVMGAILGMLAGVAIGFSPIHYTEMFGVIIVGVVVIIILKK